MLAVVDIEGDRVGEVRLDVEVWNKTNPEVTNCNLVANGRRLGRAAEFAGTTRFQ